MPKKGEYASTQRLRESVARKCPGEDLEAVVLRLYLGNPGEGVKPLGTKHIAREYATSDRTVRALIPPEYRRSRRENGQVNREFSGQTVNTSGLAAHTRELQEGRQRRLEQAERAVQAGLDPDFAQRRFHLERKAVRAMVREHRGLGRRTKLDNPSIHSKIWGKETLEQLTSWQGTPLDEEIILRRILVDQPVDRMTFKQIAEKYGYDLATVEHRERAILEAVGVLPKKVSNITQERTA